MIADDRKNEKWLDSEAAEIYREWKKRNKSFKFRDVDYEDLPVSARVQFRQLAINRRKAEGSMSHGNRKHERESMREINGKTHRPKGL